MNIKIRTLVIVAVVVIVGVTAWFILRAGWPRKEIRNVLLISIDTCRADYLGCYGYRRKITPNIDAVAKESILFENVVVSVPLTLPSHSSMLTGTTPLYHGVHNNVGYRLGQSSLSLAEVLRDKGFVTGAIVSTFILDSRFGLDQGFDTYNDRFEEELNTAGIVERKGGEASRFAIEWLEKHKNDKFFLFLHYYDPHYTYDPPQPFASSFKDNLYAGEVAYTDYCIGQVIDKLKELGIYDSTLLIITGDHGEMLGEHGESEHGFFIYESAIKVPLIFRLPGRHKPKNIKELVGLIDIVPTVCSLLGIELPSQVEGMNLSSYFSGRTASGRERYIYSESFYPAEGLQCNPLLGAVTDRWKYIETTRPELYDVIEDPNEQHNLFVQQPHRARLMKAELMEILEGRSAATENARMVLDEQTRQRLASLGYIGGPAAGEARFELDPNRPDPKDMVHCEEKYKSITYLINNEKYEQARTIGNEVLAERPNDLRIHHLLGTIYLGLGNTNEAIVYYNKYLALLSEKRAKLPQMELSGMGSVTTGEVHQDLGYAFLQVGDPNKAVEHCTEALRLDPYLPKVHCNLGNALAAQGKLDEAIEHYSKALQLEPDEDTAFKIHDNLAKALVRNGDFGAAVEHWTEAIRFKPDQGIIHNNLGTALSRQGKLAQAIEHWIESLRLEPNQYNVNNWLGEAMARQGKIDHAIAYWTQSLRINSDQPDVHSKLGGLFYEQGKLEQAIKHWSQTLRINPDLVGVLNNLAWILATHQDEQIRNPDEAIRLAQRACELTKFKHPDLLDTLSAAYAAAGEFDEAVDIAERALKLYKDSGLERKAEDLQNRMELFKKGQAYREQP